MSLSKLNRLTCLNVKQWHLGDYVNRTRNNILSITKLPRYQMSTRSFSKEWQKQRVQFPQPVCKHIEENKQLFECDDCVRFHKDIELSKDEKVQRFYYGLSRQWHQSTKYEKLIILSQLVSWTRPARSSNNSNTSNNNTNTVTTNASDNTSGGDNSNSIEEKDTENKNDEGENSESVKNRYRFPKTYKIYFWGGDGMGWYRVCINYLLHVFNCGITTIRTLLAALWKSRQNGLLIPKLENKYEGRISDWIDVFEKWFINEYRFVEAHYIDRKTNRIYVETTNGKTVTLRDIYWNFIKYIDIEAYNYHCDLLKYDEWKRTDGNPDTEPTVGAPILPSPTFGYFARKFKATFNVGLKRVGRDTCPICEALEGEKENATTDENKNKYQELLNIHQKRANDTYDLIGWCVHHFEQFWNKVQWKVGTKALTNKTLPQITVADFDHSVPEYDTNVQDAHYCSKVETHQINIVSYPGGRYTYLWSESEAGKKASEFMSLLKYHFETCGIGAGTQYIAMDGANTNVNQQFFKWCHWISWIHNPAFLFIAFVIELFHRGHNYNVGDNVGNQKNIHYGQRDIFKNTEDRVTFLNKQGVSVKAKQVTNKDFVDFPSLFDEIYLPLNKWKDENGHKFCIRDDKPVAISFQQSEIWEDKKWKVVKHPDFMYVRQSTDFKVKPRKIRIVKPSFNYNNYNFKNVNYGKCKKPKIKQNKLNGTLKLVQLANDKEMLKYYQNMKNIDESEETVQKSRHTTSERYKTQIERIKVWDNNLKQNRNDPIPQFKKNKSTKSNTRSKNKTKQKKRSNIGDVDMSSDDDAGPRDAKRRRILKKTVKKNGNKNTKEKFGNMNENDIATKCKIKQMPTGGGIEKMTVIRMRNLLGRHSLAVYGNKKDLIKRWNDHFQEKHSS